MEVGGDVRWNGEKERDARARARKAVQVVGAAKGCCPSMAPDVRAVVPAILRKDGRLDLVTTPGCRQPRERLSVTEGVLRWYCLHAAELIGVLVELVKEV